MKQRSPSPEFKVEHEHSQWSMPQTTSPFFEGSWQQKVCNIILPLLPSLWSKKKKKSLCSTDTTAFLKPIAHLTAFAVAGIQDFSLMLSLIGWVISLHLHHLTMSQRWTCTYVYRPGFISLLVGCKPLSKLYQLSATTHTWR